MKNQPKQPLINKKPMLVLSLAVFLLIISGGYFYYRSEKKNIRQEQFSNLSTIADLKTDQIKKWCEERLADANLIAESPFVRQNMQLWLRSQDSTLGKNLRERFSLLRYNNKYEDVIILSVAGKLLPGLNTSLKHLDSETIDYCKSVSQDKKAFLSDLYFSDTRDAIHFDIFAPILNDKNIEIAVLVLRVNPYDYLYPFIQSWPTSSKSAETLIVRRDGDSIIFENELRHKSNSALKLRIPLTNTKVPAVQAVLGLVGIYEGVDYRGVKVLADICPIPGTPWFMIAKVDQTEIFSELKYMTVIIIIITLLLLLFSGIGISWLYNNRQKNIYKTLLETGTALAERESQYRSLFEKSPYGIAYNEMIFDPSGKPVDYRFLEVNEAYKKIIGVDPQGKKVTEVFPGIEKYSFDWIGTFGHVAQTGEQINFEQFFESDNHWYDCVAYQSKKNQYAVVFSDITDRKQAEKIVSDNELRFRELIESLPQLFWTCRVDGPCDYLSKQWVEYTGVPEAEQLGYRWLEQLHPDDRDKTVSEWLEKVKTGKTFDIEFRIRKNDGIYNWFKTTAVPMRDTTGSILKWLGSNTDIDKIKKGEEEIIKLNAGLENRVVLRTAQLEATNKELEAFSYSVSHDLRAPLRHVSGFVDLLNKQFQSDISEKARHYLDSIAYSVHVMGALIDDLLQFSRAGRMEMRQTDFNMNEIVKEVIASMIKDNPDRKIEWVEGKLPYVHGDEAMFRLVWINLLSNAVKFTRTRKHARIEIGILKENEELAFFVRDNGVGFDMQYAQKLFGVFQRLHAMEEFEGTGIGLANAQRIVIRHGGRIWAEAEVDKGAAFYFTISKNKEEI